MWTFIAAGIKFLLVISMLPIILNGQEIQCTLFQIFPNLGITFKVDALGMIFALVASFLWIITSIYSIGYMRSLNEHSQTRYFSFFAVALSATIGVAFSANLMTMYIFYEILFSCKHILLSTHHQDEKSKKSGRKIFILHSWRFYRLCSACYVNYISFLQELLIFSSQGVMTGYINSGLGLLLSLMFLFGFAKVGIMPMHSWLPSCNGSSYSCFCSSPRCCSGKSWRI